MTFSETSKEWLELHKLRISYTTYKGYLYYLDHVTETIGDCNIAELEYKHLQAVINKKISLGYSKRTIVGIRDTMGMVFKYAMKCNYIKTNAVELLDLPRGKSTKHRGCLTKEQIDLVLSFPHIYQDYVLLLYYTGMRRGEAIALKWCDIDFEKKMICLCRATEFIGNRPVEKGTKTENGTRLIPIPQHLLERLIAMKAKSTSEYIFTQISTGKQHTHTSYRKMWNRWFNDLSDYAQSQLSIDLTRLTAHMFRHTYITLLFENDVPDLIIQKLAGHADIAFTRRQYTHLREPFLEKSYEYVRNIFEL